MSRILIAGCGYLGCALGSRLGGEGHDVWGLRRRPVDLPAGVQPVTADLARAESLGALPEALDFVVYVAGADQYDNAAYRAAYLDGPGNLLRVLREQGESPRRVFFASSTSVYGQRRGEWVDESSVTEPATWSGEILLLGERLLRGCNFPTTTLRLGGLYGPGRTRLIDSVRDGKVTLRGAEHYTNRIHRDDAVGALCHLISVEEPADLYLGVDCEPAEESVLLGWLADALRVAAPAEPAVEDRPAPRRSGSKRCRNDRLIASGYRFRYPTFREGYGAMIEER